MVCKTYSFVFMHLNASRQMSKATFEYSEKSVAVRIFLFGNWLIRVNHFQYLIVCSYSVDSIGIKPYFQ